MSSSLNLAEIKTRIAHRPPILLVDKVLAWQPANTIKTTRNFLAEDPAFNGHFPDYPVLPGVLQIEAMAQSSALLVNLTLNKTAEETLFLFMGIQSARFKNPVFPNNEMHMEITQIKTKNNVYWFKGEANVNNKICTTVEFAAKLVLK